MATLIQRTLQSFVTANPLIRVGEYTSEIDSQTGLPTGFTKQGVGKYYNDTPYSSVTFDSLGSPIASATLQQMVITGLIQQGTNITITGLGVAGNPYIINATVGAIGLPAVLGNDPHTNEIPIISNDGNSQWLIANGGIITGTGLVRLGGSSTSDVLNVLGNINLTGTGYSKIISPAAIIDMNVSATYLSIASNVQISNSIIGSTKSTLYNMSDAGYDFVNDNGYFRVRRNDSLTNYLLNGNTLTNFLGVGMSYLHSPSAVLHVEGQGSTSSTYSLKVDNTSSNPLLYIRDDGEVKVYSSLNADYATISTLGYFDASKNLISLGIGSGLSIVGGNLVASGSGGTVTSVGLTSSDVTIGGASPITGAGTFTISLINSKITGQLLTGYVSGAGTISATDTILGAIQKLNGNIGALTTGVSSVFGRTGAVTATSGDYTTLLVTENTNLYFTNARAIASTLTGYTSGAGTVSATDTILQAIQKLNGNIAGLVTGVSSFNTRTGAITLSSLDVTTALTFTPYNATNPSAYIPLTALSFAAGSGAYNNSTGVITIPTNNNQITNGAGYITGNQSITLSGNVTGTGTTAISTTIANNVITNAMIVNTTIDLTTKVTGILPPANGGMDTRTYYSLLTASGDLTASIAANTFFLGYGTALSNNTSNNASSSQVPMMIYINSADYPTVNGLPPKLRINAVIGVNGATATNVFTLGLYPLTTPVSSGGTGVKEWTIGTVVAGSDGATITNPSSNSQNNIVGNDFALPANGLYCICVKSTATTAGGSFIQVSASLQIHNA